MTDQNLALPGHYFAYVMETGVVTMTGKVLEVVSVQDGLVLVEIHREPFRVITCPATEMASCRFFETLKAMSKWLEMQDVAW